MIDGRRTRPHDSRELNHDGRRGGGGVGMVTLIRGSIGIRGWGRGRGGGIWGREGVWAFKA